MNPRQPRFTAKQVLAVLEKRGFEIVRSSGSHCILRNDKGIRITVPVHGNKILHPKILARILKDADVRIDEFGR